jgi:hypothetical protein
MLQLILVEFTDGTSCRIIPAALDLFLREENWVSGFQRSSGWVRVGHDPIREVMRDSSYCGVERRYAANV